MKSQIQITLNELDKNKMRQATLWHAVGWLLLTASMLFAIITINSTTPEIHFACVVILVILALRCEYINHKLRYGDKQ